MLFDTFYLIGLLITAGIALFEHYRAIRFRHIANESERSYEAKAKGFADRLGKLYEDNERMRQIEKTHRPIVKHVTIRAFDPNDENFIMKIGSIAESDEFVFFVHEIERRFVSAAKHASDTERQKAIYWLEGLDLVISQFNECLLKYNSIRYAENENEEI